MNLTKKELSKVISKSVTYLQFLIDDRRKKIDRRTDKKARIEYVLKKLIKGKR